MSRKTISIPALILSFIIIVAANIQSAVAVTWSVNITRMTTKLTFDGLPSITQTSDIRIWIVWAKAILGDNTIFCKTSSDLGTTWSEEESLTYIPPLITGRHDESPSIIQAANGTIWLVYHSNKPPPMPDFIIDASPKALTIPQGGSDTSTIFIYSLGNFSEAVTLSSKTIVLGISTTFDPNPVTPPGNGVATSTLTVFVEPTADPGNTTLTILGKSGDINHSVPIHLEITESGTATISDASSSSLSTSSAEDEMDREIYYKTSNDNGVTWSNRFQLTNNTNDDLSPSIVQLTNGTIMIVYGSEQGIPVTDSDIFYNATSDGTSWIYGNITADPGLDKGPSIMQAEDERIWVAWASDRTGDYEIFCKTYDGFSWSNATQLTNSTNSDSGPSIFQTIDGTIWLFWQSREDKPTATGDIYYKFSTDNGTSWSDRVQFTTDNNEDVWPAVTQTHDTRIWVVWTSNRADQPDGNWDIYYRTSLVGDITGPGGYPDGVVDIFDLNKAGKAYGSVVGEPEYDSDVDLNKDGRVDMRDIALIGKNYGST